MAEPRITKANKFLALAPPDKDGFSREVPIDELERHGLGFGNGGSWCRDDGSLARYYNIRRHKEGNRIVAVGLHGFKKQPIKKPIPARIRKAIQHEPCKVLYISSTEIDHKDGRRDDPRLMDPDRVRPDDFQALSKAANNAKRQHCKTCRKTNERFDARVLGYPKAQWKGNSVYRGSCIGCYWYDPFRFNQEICK